MNQRRLAPAPLEPYRVLDMTDDRGFFCGKLLADLGADVIKVEPPGGDAARNQGPFFGGIPHPERSISWWAFNANKRGITLDISNVSGKRLLEELVRGIDFLVESCDPGYLTCLGLDYECLARVNPALIVVSITPFGQKGPYAKYQASDIVLQAMGGFMYTTGHAEGPPVRIGYPNAYLHAGSEGAAGALIAHYYRVATGQGQHVEVSAQEAVVRTLMEAAPNWDIGRTNTRRAGNVYEEPAPPMKRRNHWPCKDGQVSYVNYGGPNFSRSSQRFYRVIQEVDGVSVDHLLDKDWLIVGDRGKAPVTQQDLDEEAEVMGPFFLRHTKAEIYEWAMKDKLMLTPVNTPRELLENSQLKARDLMVEVEQPQTGCRVPYSGAPTKMSCTPPQLCRPAPRIGENNEEIYIGELGLSREELTNLKAAKVL